MCVIIAKKCQLPGPSKKESWFLYKIRDRNYDPKYKLDVVTKNNTEALFLEDQATKWREGVNSKGLMIVSAALDNHTDVENTGWGETPGAKRRFKQQHDCLQSAIQAGSVYEAQKILRDGLFSGTSFISDGEKMVIVEIYINNDKLNKLFKEQGEEKMEKLSFAEQFDLVEDQVTDDLYDIAMQEIKEDDLVVRTNHGRLLKKAGYQPTDDEKNGWKSSTARWEYVNKAIKELGGDVHPFSVLTTISNLTEVDKIKQHNPIRPKEELPKAEQKDGMKYRYYSSSIIMLSPTGVMFLLPMSSEVDMNSQLRLKPNRKVDFVLLPKELKLYENRFAMYNLRKSLEKMIQE